MRYLTQWSFDPFVFVLAAVVAAHEIGLAHLARRSRPASVVRRRRRSYLFYAGLAVLLLTVTSPVDYWADRYFFVHMIEHLMIMFFAPMLVVAGAPWLPLLHALPVGPRRRLLRWVLLGAWSRPLRAAGRILASGWVAVVVYNAVMVIWHLPGPFQLAATNALVHVWLMHGSFFVSGVAFWLQVLPSPPFRSRLTSVGKGGAIIATNGVMLVLAMALSIFSKGSWYPVYDHVAGVTLPAFADQQIGAAILWVCGDLWALPTLIFVIRQAIAEPGSASDVVDRLLRGAGFSSVRLPRG